MLACERLTLRGQPVGEGRGPGGKKKEVTPRLKFYVCLMYMSACVRKLALVMCVCAWVCVWKGEVVIRTPSLHGFAHHTLRVCVWAWGVFFIVMKSWFNDACFLCVSLHLSVVPALIQSPSALDPIPIWWLGLMRAGSQACLSVCVLCIITLVGTFLGGEGDYFLWLWGDIFAGLYFVTMY